MLRRTLPTLLVIAALSPLCFGQADPGGGGGGPGGPGGGPPDFAQMRQQMEDRMKEQLQVTDDQWDNLQPKIDKVQQLKRELRVGGGPGGPRGGFGGGPGGGQGGGGPGGPGGGPGGPDGMGQDNAVQQAMADLHNSLQDNASDDTLKAKLATLRKAVADAKTQLAAAEKDLSGAVNAHQQAVLVSMNILE
jgi:hypothetical protein